MLQILYTQDHLARGVALSQEEAGSDHALVDTAPTAKGVDTLLCWGHGDSYSFCKKSAAEMAALVTAWKAVNPALHTVELVTCNARHYTGKSDSFANQLKSRLSGFFSSTKHIVIKALPVTVTGAANAFSILLAEPATKSWCYVTGPGTDDKIMFQGANLITSHVVNGKMVSFKGDIAQRANLMVSQHPDRKWSMNYGYFKMLRRNLVKV
jgi:hypothetical protein